MKAIFPLAAMLAVAAGILSGRSFPEGRSGPLRTTGVRKGESSSPARAASRPELVPGPTTVSVLAGEREPRPIPNSVPEPFMEYVRLRLNPADSEPLRVEEERQLGRLARMDPDRVVEFFLQEKAPVLQSLFLLVVDRGLSEDRAVWEEAVVTGLGETAVDSTRIAALAEAAALRVRDEGRRADAARRLMSHGMDDRLMRWVGAIAAGESVSVARVFLRSGLPMRGAVEGLGFVAVAEDAPLLEALGPQEPVLRALEIAAIRTEDPAFRSALQRLGR